MRRILYFQLFASLFLWSNSTKANSDLDSNSALRRFEFSAYFETFFAHNFNRPLTSDLSVWSVNHAVHNQLSLNLGLIKSSYSNVSKTLSGHFGLHTGSYVVVNYATEPRFLRNVSEAYVKLKPQKNSAFQLDFGIQSSHIGFESAIQNENLTLTRSFIAENSPYYMNGLKLTYVKSKSENNSIDLSLIVSKGWQRIASEEKGDPLAKGTQLKYQNKKHDLTLNWSTFYDKRTRQETNAIIPTDSIIFRFFSNIYIQKNWKQRWVFHAGYDQGWSWHKHGSIGFAGIWYGGTVIAAYKLTEKLYCNARLEFYNDVHAIVTTTDFTGALQKNGVSLGLRYKLKTGDLRIEWKHLSSPNRIFAANNGFALNAHVVSASFHLPLHFRK